MTKSLRLRDLPTRARLVGAFVAVSATTALVGALAWHRLERLAAELESLYQRNLRGEVVLGEANAAMLRRAYHARVFSLTADAAERVASRARMEEQDAILLARLRDYQGIASGEDRAVAQRVIEGWKEYQQKVERVFANHDPAQQARLRDDAIATRERMTDLLAKQVAAEVEGARLAFQRGSALVEASRHQIGVLALLAVVLGVALGLLAARGLVRPLRAAVSALDRVAGGDRTPRLRLDRGDELGQMARALDQALDRLSAVLRVVDERAVELAAASGSLSAVGQQLSGTSEEGAAQAASVAAAAEQVSANVQTIASSASEMNTAVREIARNSGEATGMAKAGADAATEIRQLMEELGASSSAIGTVVKLISGIAEQTNLLALNATIEAARAGEAGKGFAVVASEVKALAKASAASTEEIAVKVGAIQSATTRSIEAIGRVTDLISKIAEMQSMVAAAVEEQVATTNEIGRNVTEASTATSDIARNATGVAAAAKGTSEGAQDALQQATRLAATAAELRAQVSKFQLGDADGASPAAGAHSSRSSVTLAAPA